MVSQPERAAAGPCPEIKEGSGPTWILNDIIRLIIILLSGLPDAPKLDAPPLDLGILLPDPEDLFVLAGPSLKQRKLTLRTTQLTCLCLHE